MGTVIKELVSNGHALANEMTGAPSALVRELATQLDVQRQVAENSQREFRAADATIHNLELEVAAATYERDASVKNELVWEKTMMEACGEDGPASVASEIKALRERRDTAMELMRKQLAAVVAENAGLKAAVAENAGLKAAAEFATAPDMWIEQADGMLDYRYVDWYVDVLKAAMETPATDAYLAEVRAQAKADGVQEYADSFRHMAAKFRELYGESIRYRALMYEASTAEAFAAQLRQGAAL